MAIQIPPAEAGPSSSPYKLAHTLSGHSRSVTALRYSNDGKVLVSAGADGYLHFWDAHSGEHQRSLRAHRTGINDISLSPDSLYVSTASDDGTSTIHTLYPLPRGISEPIHPQAASHGITDAGTSSNANGNTNGTGSGSGGSNLPRPLRTLSSHTAPVLSIAFSPTSNLLATGSFDESAIVWDVRRGAVLRRLPAHAEAVWCVGWDGEGGVVITGSGDGLIRLWDAHSGQCLRTFDNESSSPVAHACFTPQSTYILSTTLSSTLRIHNIHTSKVLRTFRHPSYLSERFPCPSVVFAKPASLDDESAPAQTSTRSQHDNAWVVAGSENGMAVIWDVATKAEVGVLSGHTRPVVALAVHPGGRRIATGCLEPEKVIQIWEFEG